MKVKDMEKQIKETMSDVDREQQEAKKMIEGAKEFSRTIRGIMAQVADHEERLIRLERMHKECRR